MLLNFSIPAIIGMVVNVVDRICIGRIPNVGGLAITGVGITIPITSIIIGIGMLIEIGTSASISLSLGSNDKKKANTILNNGFLLILIASITVAIVGNVFATPLVKVFDASKNTLPFALLYLRRLILGTICNLIAFGLNHSISSDGNSLIGMATLP